MLKSIFKKRKGKKTRGVEFLLLSQICQILLSADGKYMPCSHHTGFMVDKNGKELKAKDINIEQAWNSQYMKNLRDSFIKNKKHHGCIQC